MRALKHFLYAQILDAVITGLGSTAMDKGANTASSAETEGNIIIDSLAGLSALSRTGAGATGKSKMAQVLGYIGASDAKNGNTGWRGDFPMFHSIMRV